MKKLLYAILFAFILQNGYSQIDTLKGYIIQIDNKDIYIDLNKNDVKIGQTIKVNSEPEYLIHPISKEKIKKTNSQNPKLRVINTFDEYSICKIVEGNLDELRKGLQIYYELKNESDYKYTNDKPTLYLGVNGSFLSYSSNKSIYFIDSESIKESSDDDREITLSFNPTLGYFIDKNLILGLNIFFERINQNGNNYEIIKKDISFGPFIKYYLFENEITPFVISQFNYGFYNGKGYYMISSERMDSENKSNSYSYKIGTGLSFRITKNTSFEVETSYNFYKFLPGEIDYESWTKEKSIKISFGFIVFI